MNTWWTILCQMKLNIHLNGSGIEHAILLWCPNNHLLSKITVTKSSGASIDCTLYTVIMTSKGIVHINCYNSIYCMSKWSIYIIITISFGPITQYSNITIFGKNTKLLLPLVMLPNTVRYMLIINVINVINCLMLVKIVTTLKYFVAHEIIDEWLTFSPSYKEYTIYI